MGKGSNWVLIIYKGKELEYSEYQFNYFIDDIDCIISFREFTILRIKSIFDSAEI
jgi:hypothetical protein